MEDRKEGGKEKMANKGGIVTIFVNIIPAAAQADMTLNRALSK